MAAATQQSPQAIPGAPIYHTDHKPLAVIGIRAADTLAVASGETIDMLKIPAGARIVSAYMWCSAAATSTDTDLGLFRIDTDAEVDADGLIDGADMHTTLYKGLWTGKATELLVGATLDYDSYVRATFTGDALTDDVDFYVVVVYIMP